MKIRFLVDENLSPRLEQALRDMNADIDVTRVGDPGAPPLGTLDPSILSWVICNRRSAHWLLTIARACRGIWLRTLRPASIMAAYSGFALKQDSRPW